MGLKGKELLKGVDVDTLGVVGGGGGAAAGLWFEADAKPGTNPATTVVVGALVNALVAETVEVGHETTVLHKPSEVPELSTLVEEQLFERVLSQLELENMSMPKSFKFRSCDSDNDE